VLYLAEVIQKKGGIIGGGKSELKLLACQRGEQNWSAIAGEEIIQAEDASRYSPGTLLLVDLTNTKQIQRIQEAGRPLVNILQNFSRLQEKFKTQEEEIEQWKQSLTYQSQELNRREMELETRQEQLQQMESEFEQMEEQRQQFETTREEVTRRQEELTRQRQELEGAWEQLHGQKQQLEDRQAELLGASVLDEEKAQALYQLLDRLSESVSLEALQEPIHQTHELINQQQSILSHHWQMLEQQKQSAQQMQEDVDRQVHQLDEQWQAWYHAQAELEQATIELKSKESALQIKQEYAEKLGLQIQYHNDLHQQLYRINEGIDSGDGAQVDLEALEKMSIEELQSIVQNLQRDFDQSSQFVHGQEEELELKEKEIETLKAKIAQVSEFDRLSLEAELTEEQDAYQFLNQTLVGQRRSLNEKEGILRQHKSVMYRRQGKNDPDRQQSGPDLGVIFTQIESQRNQQAEELQNIQSQIEQIRNEIQQAQETVSARSNDQDQKHRELKHFEETLKSQRASAAELVGKVTLYQEFLQPLQDSVTAMQQKLEGISHAIAQGQESQNNQQQAIEEMRQIITNLTQKPEFAIA
jgi:chromosome segregation ATPase